MKVVVVTGTPGAGKTTVLNGALAKLKETYIIVNFGDEMFKVAKKNKIVKNRDEMRKLNPLTQRSIQKIAAQNIAKKSRKMPIIVDTHSTIKTPKGYLPGLPRWVIEKINPSQIILVESDPDEIIIRRMKDTTRVRDAEYVADIKEHQMINRSAAMAYAMFTGATVKIIQNHDEKLEDAIKYMTEALKN